MKQDKNLKQSMTAKEMVLNSEALDLIMILSGGRYKGDEDELHLLRVSKDGSWVYDCDTRHFITPYQNGAGYLCVDLFWAGEWQKFYVHKLSALVFCPRTPERTVVHHIDGNKANNNPSNLLWCTPGEHLALHRLLRDGKTGEYWVKVAEIRNQNQTYKEIGA